MSRDESTRYYDTFGLRRLVYLDLLSIGANEEFHALHTCPLQRTRVPVYQATAINPLPFPR